MTTIDTSPEGLLPCPFCGSSAELEYGSDHHGTWFNLGCSRHWAKDPDNNCKLGRLWYTETEVPKAEAIRQWNTRALLSAPPSEAEIDAAARAIDPMCFGEWKHPPRGLEMASPDFIADVQKARQRSARNTARRAITAFLAQRRKEMGVE